MIGIYLIFTGSIISAIGAIGFLRFPDIYTRTHAQTVVNVGGTCLLLLGIFFQAPFLSLYSVKSLLLIIFIFLTSPVGSHAIARAAYRSGVEPKRLQEDQLKYKIIQDQRPFQKPESPKAKKPRHKFKTSNLIRKAKEGIKKRIPEKKDKW